MYTTIYLFLFSAETIIPYDLSGFISTSWVHQIRELSILNSRSAILVLQNNCLAQEPRSDTSKQLSRLRLSESDAGEKECYRTQIKNCEGGPRTLMAEDVCALLSLLCTCAPALLHSCSPSHPPTLSISPSLLSPASQLNTNTVHQSVIRNSMWFSWILPDPLYFQAGHAWQEPPDIPPQPWR